MNSRMDHIGPSYFTTLGIPILLGRDIGPQDSAGERVGVINQAFARRFFPNANPLGKHVTDTYYPGNPKQVTIVGVASDSRNTLRENIPRAFTHPTSSLFGRRTRLTTSCAPLPIPTPSPPPCAAP